MTTTLKYPKQNLSSNDKTFTFSTVPPIIAIRHDNTGEIVTICIFASVAIFLVLWYYCWQSRFLRAKCRLIFCCRKNNDNPNDPWVDQNEEFVSSTLLRSASNPTQSGPVTPQNPVQGSTNLWSTPQLSVIAEESSRDFRYLSSLSNTVTPSLCTSGDSFMRFRLPPDSSYDELPCNTNSRPFTHYPRGATFSTYSGTLIKENNSLTQSKNQLESASMSSSSSSIASIKRPRSISKSTESGLNTVNSSEVVDTKDGSIYPLPRRFSIPIMETNKSTVYWV